MRLTAFAFALLLAVPASAEWRITAQQVEWYVAVPDAVAAQARDAVLWDRDRKALDGALLTAALPRVGVTDLGTGQSEIGITMTRAQAEDWISSYAGCSDDATSQERLACVDLDIKRDLRSLVRRYRAHLRDQRDPVTEPDL